MAGVDNLPFGKTEHEDPRRASDKQMRYPATWSNKRPIFNALRRTRVSTEHQVGTAEGKLVGGGIRKKRMTFSLFHRNGVFQRMLKYWL